MYLFKKALIAFPFLLFINSANAALTSTCGFAPADAARTSMDTGGTWDGTSEIATGDTFSLTLSNTGSSAFEITPTASLASADFSYIAGTEAISMSGSGCSGSAPSISSVSVSGQDLTFNLSPAGFDLPGDCSLEITYGVTAAGTTTGGTYQSDCGADFATTDGGATSSSSSDFVDYTVLNGALIITKSPVSQTRAVGDNADFTIEVCNTGLGGLFDVVIDESALSPTNAAGSLTFISLTQTAPAAPVASGAGTAILTLPYLAPDQCFVADASATVSGCEAIENTASTSERTGANSSDALASVLLDLDTPLISYTPPAINALSIGISTVSFDVTNAGLGTAENVVLTLAGLPSTINIIASSVASPWVYDSGAGTFAYPNSLANSAVATLSFDVEKVAMCPPSPAGTGFYSFDSSYTDGCGNTYSVPSDIGSWSVQGVEEPYTIAKRVASAGTGTESRIELGDSGSWDIIVTPGTAAAVGTLTVDPVVVTDVLPVGLLNYNVGPAPAGTNFTCTGSCQGGDTITWSIPVSSLSAVQTLPIIFEAPSDSCTAGQSFENVAESTYTFTSSNCSETTSGRSGFSVVNSGNPTGEVTFEYNVADGASYETGAPDDGDLVAEHNLGEADLVPFTTEISFTAGALGQWTLSKFTDDFAGESSAQYAAGSAEVSIDSGTTFIPVPASAIVSSAPTLEINLDFLAGPGFFGVDAVDGQELLMNYSATFSDVDILPNRTKGIISTGTYSIENASSGGCTAGTASEFKSVIGITLVRRALRPTIDIPNIIQICEPTPVSITSTSESGHSTWMGWDTRIFLQENTYGYTHPQVPTYANFFTPNPPGTGNMTYIDNAGINPEWQLVSSPIEQATPGTVSFEVVLPAGSSTTPAPISAFLDYDDSESLLSPGLDFRSATVSDSPVLVKEGQLQISVTPSNLSVLGDEIEFTIYVINGGNGIAFGTQLEDIIPSAFIPNTTKTDALNPGFPVTVSGQTMSWSLGDLNPGDSIPIKVVADVNGTTCSLPPNSNQITATWGCGGTVHQTANSTLPNFVFPAANLQVVHDNGSSQVGVCEPGVEGLDVLIIKNVGVTTVNNAFLEETLNTPLTGIDYVLAGPFEYSIDGGSTWSPAGAPTGDGSTATPLRWDQNQVPELTVFEPGDEVRIRFPVTGSEVTNSGSPAIQLDGGGVQTCGDPVSSPGTPFEIKVIKPRITVAKVGRNLTTGGGFSNTVYGKPGDQIEWRVQVNNNAGDFEALNVELTDDLPNTSGAPTATLSGPGHASTSISDNVAVGIDDITRGTTNTYTVTETLGSTCLNTVNTASVLWGCSAPPTLSSPTNNTDTANLIMDGDFSGSGIDQTFTNLPDGRVETTITLTNSAAFAQNFVIENTLPAGFERDSTFVPTFASTGGVTGYSFSAGDTPTAPSFDLVGGLENGEEASITFKIIQTGSFDTTEDEFTNPETEGNSLDPALPASGNSVIDVDFQNACGGAFSDSASVPFDAATPDIDIAVSPISQIVSDGSPYSFTFTITNNGDAGSIADFITFTPTITAGWTSVTTTVTTPGAGGSGGACAATCTAAQIGNLANGASAVITISGTANNNGSPLTIFGEVVSALHADDGTATGNNLSLDTAQPRIMGYAQNKTLVSTSETFTADPNVAIGEEITWSLTAAWFGLAPGEQIENITVRDSLPPSLGYVSHVDNAPPHDVVYALTGNTPVSSGILNYGLSNIMPGGGTFDVNLVTRVLNVGASTQGASLVNNLGVEFDYNGVTFASDDADDGFGGSESDLHSEDSVTIGIPVPTFVKEVRNVTQGTGFSGSVNGDAGDTLEYRITIGNTGQAPLFDIVVNDSLDAKLNLIDGASDGINNDANGAPEGAYTSGLGGSVIFNDANTGLPVGTSLAQLDPAETIELLYRATVDVSAIPNETLSNSANMAANTLPGASGNQSSSPGTSGDSDGERDFTLMDTADLVMDSVTFDKVITSTSVGLDTSPTVLVGEQIEYEISIVVPEGTVPALNIDDEIPAGLRLMATPTVNLNSSGCPAPTITPAAPASGAVNLNFNFGNCSVPSGTAAQRTVTVRYILQVENIASNVTGITRNNKANYSFTGFTSPDSVVGVTIAEPNIDVTTKTVAPTSGYDAGDTLTYTVTLTNNGNAIAYDLNLTDALPSDVTYVASSTTGTSGPVIGEPQILAGTLIWGRTQAPAQVINLNPAQTLSFTYEVTVNNTLEPGEVLTNDLNIDYTSLPGDPGPNLGPFVGTANDPDGERGGNGTGPNTYTGSASADATAENAFAVNKTASGDTVTGGGFQVGDLVTYAVELTLQEGTVDSFVLNDTLPTGLEFFDLVSLVPASSTGAGSINYTTPTNPTAGDTALSWNFGTVVVDGDNNAANNTMTLTYRAIVTDTGGVANAPSTQSLDNSADIDYETEDGTADGVGPSVASIDVKQPLLTIGKALAGGQASEVGVGDTVNFVVTVTNTGDAPAYNASINDLLPTEMRDTAPTTVSSTLNGAAITLGAPSWDGSTADWDLSDAQPINPSQTWVIEYQATVDNDIGGGLTFTNSATADEYCSLPSADTSTETRCYPATTPSTVDLTTPSPTDMSKTVDLSSANIGDEVTYTITVPATAVNIDIYEVNVLDDLPAGLKISSVTTNAGTIGSVVTDSSTLTDVDLLFDVIPQNEQAVVTVKAIVENVASNQDATDLDNDASFTWASTDGGAAEPAITTGPATVTITEPELTINKTIKSQVIADAGVGPQAGDQVTYTIAITNTGTGDAHDIVIRDLASEHLINPNVAANPENPGAPNNAGTASGVTTWDWTVAGPIAATTGTYTFDITFTLGPDTEPYMNISNSTEVECTSTAGANPDERTGADGETGLNDCYDEQDTPVVFQTGTISTDKRIKAPGTTDYGIGDEVTYEVLVGLGQGSIDDLHVLDSLPAGLIYLSSSLTNITNITAQGGGALAILTAPAANTSGATTLDFEIGDVISTGASPSFIVEVVARVEDVPANTDGTALTNSSSVTLEDPDDGSTVTVNAMTSPIIDVVESELVLAIDGPANVDLGVPADFTANVENTGNHPAYQPQVELELPAGMRATDPTTLPLTVSISGGRTLTLVAGVDYTVSYDPVTGRLIVDLISAQGFIDAGEKLVVDFDAAIDNGSATTTGTALQIIGTVSGQGSQDASGGAVVDNRIDTTTFNSGTLGTANGATGDDQHDDHEFDARAPELLIVKSVDLTTARPGDTLNYTVTLTNNGAIDANVTTITDDMDISFEPGTMTTPVVAGSAVDSATDNSTGGANGTGTWTINGLTVPTGGAAVTITFSIDLKRPLPSGTVIGNQTSADVAGYDDPVVSDSSNASDDDGADTGNDSGDANDDDPTLTTIESAPILEVIKNSSPDTPPLAPGGTITYTISMSNTGDENLINAVLTDSIPANTTYVPNSTILDPSGAATSLADVGGTSPLVAGVTVTSSGVVPAPAAGTLVVDTVVEYSFQVTVDAGVTNGTIISNQAFLNGEGEGSGPVTPQPSDDPDTSFGPDPTTDTVGSGPSLYSVKTVTDLNGGTLLAGETLEYEIVLINNGSADAINIDFTDAIPTNTTYVPASIVYDDDNTGPNPAVAQSDAADGDAADTATGDVHVVVGTLPAGQELKITFQVLVDAGAADGTLISNQGTFTSDGLPPTDTDSDSDPSNGSQPTDIIVGDNAALVSTKQVLDVNGGAVEPGDVLRYTINVTSIGSIDATNVVLTDPMPTPASVTYNANTTTLNSIVQADVGADSPLVGGLSLGTIAVSDAVVVTYEVTVPAGLPAGTNIDNQASFTSDNASPGVSDSDLDDGIENGNDGTDPNDDDPTRVQVGGSPGVANVSGNVWLDENHDRIFDASEPPQEGWTVEILNGGVVVATTTTDATGAWNVNGLAPGSGYQVRYRHPVTNTAYGAAVSSEPGTDTSDGTIQNLTLPNGTTIIDQNLPLDPSGVIYDAVSRQPVPGAIVEITGPAGFDPLIHLLPGQAVQTTAADGYYRFDLLPTAPAGNYTIVVTNPPAYLPGPSTIIPPDPLVCDPSSVACNPGLTDPFLVAPQSGAPQAADPTVYYLEFNLDAGDPLEPDTVNNHIAIDPILKGAISVTKTAGLTDVSVGDFIPYTIIVKNNLAANLQNLDVEDILPPSFTYMAGSATVDGVPQEPTQVGNKLSWINETIAPNTTKIYKILVVVGAGTSKGTYCNKAQVRQNLVDEIISNVSKACTKIVPNPIFDCPDLIGQVFDDKNRDGYQDKGEKGLASVKLLTTKGWIVKTDSFGRYHITCPINPKDRGSNFAVKVDTRSLPTGYRITSENPAIVRLTKGKLSKANFGASIHRVIGIDLEDEAFIKDEKGLNEEWEEQLETIAEIINKEESVVRITYYMSSDDKNLVKKRIKALKKKIKKLCDSRKIRKRTLFEEVIHQGGVE